MHIIIFLYNNSHNNKWIIQGCQKSEYFVRKLKAMRDFKCQGSTFVYPVETSWHTSRWLAQ